MFQTGFLARVLRTSSLVSAAECRPDVTLTPSLMHNHSTARRSLWMLAASLSSLTACGDATAPAGGNSNLSLSFAAQVAPAGTARTMGAGLVPGVSLATGTNAAGNVVLVGAANDTLVITGVQLVLNEVKLRRADVTSCPAVMPERSGSSERSSDDKGCSRLDLGPMLLDLPLSDAGSSKLAVAIPAGSYREIEFELDRVEGGSGTSATDKAFLAANPDFANRSVRVTGTYKGQAFTFTSKVEAEVEMEFEPAIVVETGSNDNITIALDLARWFRDSAGRLLAPTVENQSRIEQNIATSFDAFGDRDRDGKEDPGRSRTRSRSGTP